MAIFTLLLVHLVYAPVVSDRAAAPVEVEAPGVPAESPVAPIEAEAPGVPAEPESQPQAQPQPQPIEAKPYFGTPLADPRPPPQPDRPRAPARPVRWRVDVLGSFGTALFRDTAWRAFDRDRNAVQFGLTLRGDARLGSSRVFLGGGASFRRFAAGGSVYEAFTTRLLAREPIGFVRLAVAARDGIDVFAQAGGGVGVVDTSWQSTRTASQRSVVPLAEGLAGVALYLPRRLEARGSKVRFTGGFELGAGYTWRGDLDLRPRVDAGDDPITTDSAALGDVALRGFTWRMGVFIRFQ